MQKKHNSHRLQWVVALLDYKLGRRAGNTISLSVFNFFLTGTKLLTFKLVLTYNHDAYSTNVRDTWLNNANFKSVNSFLF